MKRLNVILLFVTLWASSVHSRNYHPTYNRYQSHGPVGYHRSPSHQQHYRPHGLAHRIPSHVKIILAIRDQHRAAQYQHAPAYATPSSGAPYYHPTHVTPSHGPSHYHPVPHVNPIHSTSYPSQHVNSYHANTNPHGGYQPNRYSHINILLAARQKLKNNQYAHLAPAHRSPIHANPSYGAQQQSYPYSHVNILLAARNKVNNGYRQNPHGPTYSAPSQYSPRHNLHQEYPARQGYGVRQQPPGYSHLLALRNKHRPTYITPVYANQGH